MLDPKNDFNFDEDSIEKILNVLKSLKLDKSNSFKPNLESDINDDLVQSLKKYNGLYNILFEDTMPVTVSAQRTTIAMTAFTLFKHTHMFNENIDMNFKDSYARAINIMIQALEQECINNHIPINDNTISNVKQEYIKLIDTILASQNNNEFDSFKCKCQLSFEDALMLKILIHGVFKRQNEEPMSPYILDMVKECNNIIKTVIDKVKNKFSEDLVTIFNKNSIVLPHAYILKCECSYCKE